MAALELEEAELIEQMKSLGMPLMSEESTDAPRKILRGRWGAKSARSSPCRQAIRWFSRRNAPKQRSSGEGSKERAIPTPMGMPSEWATFSISTKYDKTVFVHIHRKHGVDFRW